MAKESSFDIVSKVELPEVQNAVQAALKEIKTVMILKEVKVIFLSKRRARSHL